MASWARARMLEPDDDVVLRGGGGVAFADCDDDSRLTPPPDDVVSTRSTGITGGGDGSASFPAASDDADRTGRVASATASNLDSGGGALGGVVVSRFVTLKKLLTKSRRLSRVCAVLAFSSATSLSPRLPSIKHESSVCVCARARVRVCVCGWGM
jgi:hypothetical protein